MIKFLKKVMKRALDRGVRFNKDKVQYKVKELSYIGHIFWEGVKPDPHYIQPVLDVEEPTNKKKWHF